MYPMCTGEEYFLLWQNWGFTSVSSVMNLMEHSIISLEASSYIFLKDKNSGLNCGYRQEEDYRFYTDCLRQYLDSLLEDFICLPTLLVNYTSRYKKRVSCKYGHAFFKKNLHTFNSLTLSSSRYVASMKGLWPTLR